MRCATQRFIAFVNKHCGIQMVRSQCNILDTNHFRRKVHEMEKLIYLIQLINHVTD